MDYQTFNNSQQPQFAGFNNTSSAPSPQNALHPQAQQAFLHNQQSPYQYASNNGQAFAGGGGAPMNMNMMQQPMQPGGMQRCR